MTGSRYRAFFHMTIILVCFIHLLGSLLIQFYAKLSSIESLNKKVTDSRINRRKNETGIVAWLRCSTVVVILLGIKARLGEHVLHLGGS